MSDTLEYDVTDIERFLAINKELNSDEHSASLRKLLSVQDKIPIFRGIEQNELKAIVYDVSFVRVSFKDYIIQEGDESSSIFFIIDGECQVFHKSKKVGSLHPGEVFGESGVIFKTKRNASVVCASKSATLLSFKVDENNLDFCAPALAQLYLNLAKQINTKLEDINYEFIKK